MDPNISGKSKCHFRINSDKKLGKISMEVKAITKNIRISPEKMNLLAVQIKKMNPLEAINVLTLVNKSSAPILKKIIKSAVANAKHNFNLSVADLFFKEIIVTKGPMSKRYQPISRGRAHHILKRTSHVTVVLSEKPKKETSEVIEESKVSQVSNVPNAPKVPKKIISGGKNGTKS